MTASPNASLFTYPRFLALNTEGYPLAGGKLYSYQAGTLTPQATYTNATLTVPNPNPIILDSFGTAAVWLSSNAYKFNLLDVNGVQQADFPIDNVTGYAQASAVMATTAVLADLASTAAGQGDALVGVLQSFTGAQGTNQGIMNQGMQSILGFMTPGQYAAWQASPTTYNMTSIVNAAVAGCSGVSFPAGTYFLNALNPITQSCQLIGDGGSTYFLFNTTFDCININPASQAQANRFTIRDISFGTTGNVPSSIIANTNGINVMIERCFFCALSATYLVDSRVGYGTKIKDCVFYNFVGTAIRLRDNGASPYYSYISIVESCDITGNSVYTGSTPSIAMEIEQAFPGPISLINTAIENCYAGIKCNTKAGGGQTWNLQLDGCYFESNFGYDLDLSDHGSAAYSSAVMTACSFAALGNPCNINLGAYGKLLVNSCSLSGASVVTVTGSGIAEFHNYNSGTQWTQSGTFVFTSQTGQAINYSPGLTGFAATTNNCFYSITGRLCTVQALFIISTIPTTGQTMGVSLPVPCNRNLSPDLYASNPQVGTALAQIGGGNNNYMGAVFYNHSLSTVQISTITGVAQSWGNVGGVSVPGAPGAWTAGDIMTLNFSYFI